MKPPSFRFFRLGCFLSIGTLVLLSGPLTAMTLKTKEGVGYDGEIAMTAGESVFLKTDEVNMTLLKKNVLDGDSLAAIEVWEAAHPENAALATKFDEKPQVVRKRIPNRSELRGVSSAVIMLALLVDETGSVEDVLVKDASDDRVIRPTCKALSHWKFAPLTVNAEPRRAVIFLPVQF